jgi:hypothetical protein
LVIAAVPTIMVACTTAQLIVFFVNLLGKIFIGRFLVKGKTQLYERIRFVRLVQQNQQAATSGEPVLYQVQFHSIVTADDLLCEQCTDDRRSVDGVSDLFMKLLENQSQRAVGQLSALVNGLVRHDDLYESLTCTASTKINFKRPPKNFRY